MSPRTEEKGKEGGKERRGERDGEGKRGIERKKGERGTKESWRSKMEGRKGKESYQPCEEWMDYSAAPFNNDLPGVGWEPGQEVSTYKALGLQHHLCIAFAR